MLRRVESVPAPMRAASEAEKFDSGFAIPIGVARG
jgi:hypothetical protein